MLNGNAWRMLLVVGVMTVGTARAAVVPMEECSPCTADCVEEAATDNDGDALTACQEACFGSSDSDVDSDGDGMPDGWEVQYCLDPARDDSTGMPDGDAFNNIQEFGRGSDPVDAASPGVTFFVSVDGLDAPERGTMEAPFRSIGYALETGAEKGLAGFVIWVDAGLYEEDVVLLPGVIVRGFFAEIMGTITGAEGAELHSLELIAPPGAAAIDILGHAMRIENCSIRGERSSSTGILITGGSAKDVIINIASISEVLLGVDAEAGLPTLARVTFSNINAAAILVRCDDGQPSLSQPAVGDAAAGYNSFYDSVAQVAVVNQCSQPIHLDRNDWNVAPATEAGIAARIDGEVVYSGFLQAGGGIDTASLRCHVYRAGTVESPIAGATVRVGGLTGITDARGIAHFNALAPQTVQVSVEADGYASQSRGVTLRGIVFGNSETFYMEVDEDGEPLPACNGPEQKLGTPQPGQLLLSAMVFAALSLGSVTMRRQRLA